MPLKESRIILSFIPSGGGYQQQQQGYPPTFDPNAQQGYPPTFDPNAAPAYNPYNQQQQQPGTVEINYFCLRKYDQLDNGYWIVAKVMYGK